LQEHEDVMHMGPATLEDVLKVPAAHVRRLLRYADAASLPMIRQELETVCRHGVILTSSFSGTGGFEAMALQVLDECAKVFGMPQPKVIFYSACDILPESLLALSNHHRSRPQHIFGDLLDRLTPDVKDSLVHLQKETLQLWKDTQLEHADGGVSSEELAKEHKRISERYVDGMHKKLDLVEFNDVAWCTEHQAYCPLSPRSCADYKDYFWIEAAGSICKAFSAMGSRNQWLDPSALVCQVWCYSCRYFEPDVLLHECVSSFPPEALDTVLNRSVETQCKCIFSRPMDDADNASGKRDEETDGQAESFEEDEGSDCFADNCSGMVHTTVATPTTAERPWAVHSFLFSPTDLGVPAHRPRRYTLCLLERAARCIRGVDFRSAFFAKVLLDGSIYLPKKGGPSASKPCAGDLARLEGYQLAALKQGLCDVDLKKWNASFLVCNVSQRVEFNKLRRQESMPTVLRNTRLWDLVGDRPVDVAVHWMIQGFPHPHASHLSQDLCKYFPFPAIVGPKEMTAAGPRRRRNASSSSRQPGAGVNPPEDRLTDAEQRSLTGNAMHWAASAAVLIFCLGCTQKPLLAKAS